MSGVVIAGASERTLWTYWMMRNLELYGYPGDVWPVNPSRSDVFGVPCLRDIDDVPGQPEIGVVIVRPDLAVAAVERLVDLGATTIIVVSNGFRESGTTIGIAAEHALQQVCTDAGAQMLGPNCVGYASLHDGVCAIAEPVPPSMRPGAVTVTSHSGAMLSGVLGALDHEGLGIDQCYSIGNGASFDMADSLAAGVASPHTEVICAVIESTPPRDRLEEIVAAGHRAGKEFVFLLLGQSSGGRNVAQSHTGALIGEQRLTRAWLRSIGVTVATSVEELARVATLLSTVGRPQDDGKGVFIVASSGGGAGLAADLAEKHGVPIAQISDATRKQMARHLVTGAFVGNPLDLGNAVDQEARVSLVRAVSADPSVGLLLNPYTISWPDDTDGTSWHRKGFEDFANQSREFGVRGIVCSIYDDPLTPWADAYRERTGLAVTPGLDTTMAALGHMYPGEANGRSAGAASPGDATRPAVIGEEEGRDLLVAAGLPIVPGTRVRDVSTAAAVAARSPGPWVLKLGLPGVAHKGRVGGVKVGLWGETAVRAAGEQIAAAAVSFGLAETLGEVPLLMEEMHNGPEILLGAVRDDIVGPSITISLGGWSAEAATPFGVLTLPIADDELRARISRWKMAELLGDDRASELVHFVAALSRAFVSGALASYSVVEINPLILGQAGPVAADVLIIP